MHSAIMGNSNSRRRKTPTTAPFLSGLVLAAAAASVESFASPMFQEVATLQKTAPSKTGGVEIELPDFDELFGRIKQVSPLARVAMDGGGRLGRGFEGIDDSCPPDMKWKIIDSNKRKTVHHIDKIDNFQNLGSPILRFRSSLNGPCIGERFANFIMDLDERKKWDPQIEQVYEAYPINDLDTANIAMGFGKYGDCSRLGIGYCQTKANLAVTSREQLTMCGIQDFKDGSCVIWGTEMENWHNHLLPEGKRHTRAKSHIFSTTLVPTGPDSFDVEYVLQLEIGGQIPKFLTAPIVTETVKGLFNHAERYFEGGEGGELDNFLKNHEMMVEAFGLLMTP